VVLALLVFPVVSGSAQAHKKADPVFVDIITCLYVGGEITVDAGKPLMLDAGWAGLTPRHLAWFLLSARTVASIDGHPIRHAWSYWGKFEKSYPFPDLPWVTHWDYPHKALKAGQSFTIAYDWYLRFPVSDGVDWYPRGMVNAQLGALPSCTVTAE